MALRHKWKQRQKQQAAVLQEIADRLAPPKFRDWNWGTPVGWDPKIVRNFSLQQIERRLLAQVNEACGIRGLRANKLIIDDLHDTAQQTPAPQTPRSQGPGRDRWTAGAGGPHALQPRRSH